MLYTQVQVRDNIRNRDGKRVFFLGRGDQLTSEARDYLNRERIEIRPAEQAKIERYRLLSGGFSEEKPEHMTHLYGDVLVPKTHPRIAFRGAVDSLEAELLLCGQELPEPYCHQLEELLAFTRTLLRCEVLGEPVKEEKLWGMTEADLRQRSHRPQAFYGQPHFMPDFRDGKGILLLNRARCAARHGELMAVKAFLDTEGNPTRQDLIRGMNRISSAIYLLMIQLKSREGQ